MNVTRERKKPKRSRQEYNNMRRNLIRKVDFHLNGVNNSIRNPFTDHVEAYLNRKLIKACLIRHYDAFGDAEQKALMARYETERFSTATEIFKVSSKNKFSL